MKKILLYKLQYSGLGDRLDALVWGWVVHQYTNEPIVFYQPRGKFKDFDFLLKILQLPSFCSL